MPPIPQAVKCAMDAVPPTGDDRSRVRSAILMVGTLPPPLGPPHGPHRAGGVCLPRGCYRSPCVRHRPARRVRREASRAIQADGTGAPSEMGAGVTAPSGVGSRATATRKDSGGAHRRREDPPPGEARQATEGQDGRRGVDGVGHPGECHPGSGAGRIGPEDPQRADPERQIAATHGAGERSGVVGPRAVADPRAGHEGGGDQCRAADADPPEGDELGQAMGDRWGHGPTVPGATPTSGRRRRGSGRRGEPESDRHHSEWPNHHVWGNLFTFCLHWGPDTSQCERR